MHGANSLIGQKIERLEDARFLRGAGIYVGDLRLPGTLHAVILRSGAAHGLLRGIDASAALAMPGVHAVITAADIAATMGSVPRIPFRPEPAQAMEHFIQPVLAEGRVRYVGEPIAIVLADSAARAEDAMEAIAVEIEQLPTVADCAESESGQAALSDTVASNRAADLHAAHGDADAAFATAPYTRRAQFRIGRHSAVMMEPRGLLAEWKGAQLRLYGAAKMTFPNRRLLARLLALPEADVELIENDVGGGFGVRGEFYPEDFLIPFAARHVGRPVRWIEDRREHMMTANHARDISCDLEIACAKDGTILAFRGAARADFGAYIRTAGTTAMRNVVQMMSGPYVVPNIDMRLTLWATNKTPVGTYRAPGRFEADFCRERLVDMAATDLGIDRVAFRRHNLITAHPHAFPDIAPLGMPTETDSGDYAETLDRCLQLFNWDDRSALSGRLIEGRLHGVALGCYIEGGGVGPREFARLILEADGRVAVHVGSTSVGQGMETIFAQIAADALDLPLTAISRVAHGTTSLLTDGFGSYGSRSTVMGGSAVVETAAKLLAALRGAAAARLGCAAASLVYVDAGFTAPDGARATLADLAPLTVDGVFASDRRTYSYGTHAAHVAVDPGTGHVEVIDYAAVEDVGRAINPLTLHGQAVGAVVQGLGGALFEQFVYDNQAQLLTGSLADYLLPSATDIPPIHAVTLANHPCPHNPLGAKGAGEGGIIPVGGVIANAVADALREAGAEPNELPLTPPRVWSMARASR